jgi:hypothetical protein
MNQKLIVLFVAAIFFISIFSSQTLPTAGSQATLEPAGEIIESQGETSSQTVNVPQASAANLMKSYGPPDFKPSASTVGFAWTNGLVATTDSPGTGFYCRIDLPQGAVITSIDFTFVDNSASDINFSLRMLAPYSNIALSSVTSSGALAGVQTLTISPNVVVDNAYGYQLRIGFTSTSDQIFNQATVHYVPSTTFLPTVIK